MVVQLRLDVRCVEGGGVSVGEWDKVRAWRGRDDDLRDHVSSFIFVQRPSSMIFLGMIRTTNRSPENQHALNLLPTTSCPSTALSSKRTI